MPQRPAWRPENMLVLALVVFGGALLGALLLVLPEALRDEPAGTRSMAWYAVAVLAAGGVAGALLLAYGRKLRRQQRPDWLETQAWHQGMVDQVQKGPQRGSGAPAAPPDPESRRGPET